MAPKWSQNNPQIIPCTPSHPRLGKKTATRQKKIEKNTLGVIFMWIEKNDKKYIKKYNIREHTEQELSRML